MAEKDLLAEHFEEHRLRLRRVAYRLLGSMAEAEDAVQETWIRVSRADSSEVDNLGGWLTTIVARVALNMLRARNTRREEPYEGHHPDPVVILDGELQPEEEALMADSLSSCSCFQNTAPRASDTRMRKPAARGRHSRRKTRR